MRRQLKAVEAVIRLQYLNFRSNVKCRVKFRLKIRADSYRLVGCRDQTRDSCRPKLWQNATEGMTKMLRESLIFSTGQDQGQSNVVIV